MLTGERNIEWLLDQADPVDNREGMVAYECYHNLLQGCAAEYNLEFRRVVAAFVSLSPNNDYIGNLRSLTSVIRAHHPAVAKVTTYKHCAERAWEYLHGSTEFEKANKGLKIWNFYWNILTPTNPDYVTIDGHMMNAWEGAVRPVKDAIRKASQYHAVARGFKRVAARMHLRPNQVQGIAWFVWKRIHNIRYDSQIHFDRAQDPWGLRLDMKELSLLVEREESCHPKAERRSPTRSSDVGQLSLM